MHLNLYVAGRFKDYARVRDVIDTLISAGHIITHDWTRTNEFDQDGNPVVPTGPGQSVDAMTSEQAMHYAKLDLMGVSDADAVVLMAEEGLYGALIEVGAALAQDVEVWIVGKMPRGSVFFEMNLVRRFDQIEDVIRYMDRWA